MSNNDESNTVPSGGFNESDADEVELLVEKKIKEQFRSLQNNKASDSGGRWGLSRRTMLGMMGAGVAGAGMVTASVDTSRAAEPDPSGNPDVIYADTAMDIQPAIDKLAEDIDGGGARGGVVQLGAKTYYPQRTIFLKGGVTLRGVRRSRQTWPEADYTVPDTRSTVISTANMNRGAEAYTFEHDPQRPHPHFPVITGFIPQPVEDGQTRTRDPTEYEERHHAHDVGVKNVILKADKQRWWDWGKHGAGSAYDTETEATYFGVYDALMFEQCRNVVTENIETIDFLGYGGFWKDCPNAIDRGGMYRGGATDHHGNAYELLFDPDKEATPLYVSGMWDFQAEGPMPTAHFKGHIDNHFVSGGWSPHNKITGRPEKFIGDEQTYRNGNAPLTDPSNAKTVLKQTDQRTKRINGYWIAVGGNASADYAIDVDDNQCVIRNTVITGNAHYGDIDVGIRSQGSEVRLENVTINGANTGLYCANFQPSVNNLVLDNVTNGIKFSGRADPNGPMNGVRFKNVTKAFENSNNKPVVLNYPSFEGCDEFGENFEQLLINMPTFHDSVSNFPTEYKVTSSPSSCR